MILSRFVKIQLVIFTVMGLVASGMMLFTYMRVQAPLGVGRMTVTLDTTQAGGLYRYANVTYRGVNVGQVTGVSLTPDGVRATMSISTDRRIPADLEAEIRSMSAVGEQYVDLRPRTDDGPWLHDGAVISGGDVSLPQPVAPMLEKLNSLVTSIPRPQLFSLVDSLNESLGGRGYDLQSLVESTSTLASGLNGVGGQTRSLLEGAVPLVDSQAQSLDAIRIWTDSLQGFTGQVVTNTPQIRQILTEGPGFANQVTAALDSVKLTVPVLLANVSSIGQLAVTYNASLEQILVLLPPVISIIQAVQPNRNAEGLGLGTFRVGNISAPPACTVGFLPPDQWRPPQDTTTIDTPPDLYCKLPQDSPISVRGARNYPCPTKPGKRAPTAAMCNSDESFTPTATSQPVRGPYPPDPNTGTGATAAPSAAVGSGPDIVTAPYDPSTGRYVGSDGMSYAQSNLAAGGRPTSWKTMVDQCSGQLC